MCLFWGGVKAGWPDRRGLATVVQAGTAVTGAELGHVPVAWTLTTHQDARELLGTVFDMLAAAARFYAFSPGTPPDRRDIVRRALMETLRDPAYRIEAQAIGVAVDPVNAEELTGKIRAFLDLPARLVEPLKQALTSERP